MQKIEGKRSPYFTFHRCTLYGLHTHYRATPHRNSLAEMIPFLFHYNSSKVCRLAGIRATFEIPRECFRQTTSRSLQFLHLSIQSSNLRHQPKMSF